MDEQLAKRNLYKCDCSDKGKHIDLDYHESGCNYALWYILNDEDEDYRKGGDTK